MNLQQIIYELCSLSAKHYHKTLLYEGRKRKVAMIYPKIEGNTAFHPDKDGKPSPRDHIKAINDNAEANQSIETPQTARLQQSKYTLNAITRLPNPRENPSQKCRTPYRVSSKATKAKQPRRAASF